MTHSRSINARSRPQQRSWRWLECLMTMSVLLLISVVSASSPGEDALPTFSAPDAVRHQPSVLSPLSNATATDEVLLRPVLRSPSSTDSERSDLLPADDMADVVNIVFKGEKGVVDTIKDWLDTKTSLSIVMGVCGGIIAVSLLAIICCCCHSDPGPSIKQIEEAKQKLANAPVVVEPTIGNGKLTVIVCDVENAAELWNLRPDKYEWVDAAYKSELRNCCSSNNCFELKSVGSLFIFTANRPVDGVKFAAAVQDYFPSVKAAGRLVPRVRIAVHRGDCKVTRDVRTGKYECTGAAVEGALWTMIDTTPGHAWATEPVYEVLTPEELETVDLRVVGERAVRGLRKNFNMYEVFTAGGSAGFPAPSIDSPVMGSLANTKAMKESPAGGPNDNPLARPSSSKSAISPNSDSARSPRSPRTSSSRRRRGEQANAIHYPERPTSGRGRTVVQIDDRPRSPSAFPPTETGSPPALQRSKDGKLVIPLSPSQLFGRRRRGSLPTEEPSSPVGSPVPTSILRNKVNTAPPTPTPVVPDDGKLIVKSQPFPPDLTDETIPDHPSQMNQARMKHFHFALYPETYMRSATEMPNAK